MAKVEIGSRTFLYPMPVTLVGAQVGGRPNYLAVSYCCGVQEKPAMIAVSLTRSHYTNQGIKETGTFSVNVPSEDMVEVTDHCGMVSGRRSDKSSLFSTFYGKLETAPMIRECPINLECRLAHSLDLGGGEELFVGEIVATYAEDRFLTDGLPDIKKMNPFVFSMHDDTYWRVGEYLGKAFSIGRPRGGA